MTHFPRIPANLQFPDLIKSSPAGTPMTDVRVVEDVPTVSIHPDYKVPSNRVLGNEVFRRMPNGMIDFDHAVLVVMDALNLLKARSPLNERECMILAACFPEAAAGRLGLDPKVSMSELKSKLRISEAEVSQISALTAVRLMEMHEWLTFAIRV